MREGNEREGGAGVGGGGQTRQRGRGVGAGSREGGREGGEWAIFRMHKQPTFAHPFFLTLPARPFLPHLFAVATSRHARARAS